MADDRDGGRTRPAARSAQAGSEASSPSTARPAAAEKPVCFVLMPFSDPAGYAPGHFQRVYADIFKPAIEAAGYVAFRADDPRETEMIHLTVLRRLLDAPIALCDLSTRNPNVLFELGFRQAFDKPVVLVQETGTPTIFDIAPLRYAEYRPARLYHEVLEDQERIRQAIVATVGAREREEGVNSLVRLLALSSPASLPALREAEKDPVLQLVREELAALRREVRSTRTTPPSEVKETPSARESDQIGTLSSKLSSLLWRLQPFSASEEVDLIEQTDPPALLVLRHALDEVRDGRSVTSNGVVELAVKNGIRAPVLARALDELVLRLTLLRDRRALAATKPTPA